MNKKYWWFVSVVAVCAALAVAGCQSYGGSAAAGSAVGAGAGAIIGNQSGSAGEGALIGAVLGGLAGLIAKDVQVQKAKDQQATADAYDYQPSQGEMLTFEDASVLPSTVKRGNRAEAMVQYALLGVGSTQVRETRSLVKDGDVISQFSSKTFTRPDGTWVSTVQFRIPDDIAVGTYQIIQRVETATSAISNRTEFDVI